MSEHASTEVISAFVDGEPFDPAAMTEALSGAHGRELLIDLVALRHLITDDGVYEVRAASRPARAGWKTLAAAAAIVLALGGGYMVGRAATNNGLITAAVEEAPAPTRVIELQPADGVRR